MSVLERLDEIEAKIDAIDVVVSNILKLKVQAVGLCRPCWGTGVVNEDTCPTCEGQRVVPTVREFT